MASSTNQALSSEDEIEVVDAAEYHPAYKVLKGYGKLSSKDKQKLLAPFAESKHDTDVFPRWMLEPGNSKAASLLANLRHTGQNKELREKNWKTTFMAKTIVDLVTLCDTAANPPDGLKSASRPTKIVQSFLKVVTPIVQEAVAKQETDKGKQKRSSILKQTGILVQEGVSFSTLTPCRQACPVCGHHYNAIVEDNRDSLAEQRQKYHAELSEWEKTRTKTKEKRPSPPQWIDSRVACFCYQQHCRLDPEGKGCITCESLYGSGSIALVHEQSSSGKRTCTCEICQCQCNVLFKLSKRNKVAAEEQTKKEVEQGTHSFFLLISSM